MTRLILPSIALNNAAPIDVTAVVRTVHGQRQVVLGEWSGHKVYAKVFMGSRARSHYQRDLNGIEALIQAKLLTPPVLFAGEAAPSEAASGHHYVIVLLAIDGAINVEALWPALDNKQRFYWAHQLVKLLAAHHAAHLVQTDMYLKNFLVANHMLYTIDGDGIRIYKKISKLQALRNLATLLAKFDVLDLEACLQPLLDTYVSESQAIKSIDHKQMRTLVHGLRQQAIDAYADKKVFRQCTDVNVRVDASQYSAVASAFAHLPLPETDVAMDAVIATAQSLKAGNTCTVALASFAETKVVIKRYNIKNSLHRISRLFRPTRAAASWANAHRLQLLGIATPKPIALIEQCSLSMFGYGLRGKAYFLSEYVEAPDVAEYFARTSDKAQRADTVKQIVQLCYRLFLLNISHGDMKYSNIKVLNGQPMLIDLDSMQQHRSAHFAQKSHVRDLRRLMQNWQDDASLYNAFVKVFKVVYADHTPLHLANILSH